MIPHNHDHTGVFGTFFGVFGYFVGMASGVLPEPHHYWAAIITAGSSAFVGWAVTKLCNWGWKVVFKRFTK